MELPARPLPRGGAENPVQGIRDQVRDNRAGPRRQVRPQEHRHQHRGRPRPPQLHHHVLRLRPPQLCQGEENCKLEL